MPETMPPTSTMAGNGERQHEVQDVGDETRGMPVDVGAELVQGDRRIGAERKEGGGAEVHIAAVAAEDVPGGGQHDVLQHDVAGEEQVVVAQRERAAKKTAPTASATRKKAQDRIR